MLGTRRKTLVIFTLWAVSPLCLAQGNAAETTSPTQQAPASVDPGTLPKGYDDSFQTGDIPKPTSPELDPDATGGTDLNPEQNPDLDPNNQVQSDLLTSDFLIGASASLSFPHIMNLAVESKIFRKFGISANYGNVTRNINEVDLDMKHFDIRFRWFPMDTSFFAGVAVGQHQMTGELNRDIKEPTSKTTISSHGKLTASANYVVPHIGWFSIWDSGFTMGFDLGYLVPMSPESKFTATFSKAPEGTDAALRETNEYKNMKKDLEDSAKSYASKPLPFATFLRMGWMF